MQVHRMSYILRINLSIWTTLLSYRLSMSARYLKLATASSTYR